LNGENGKARILFSNPAHETSRRNNTLRLSNNDGETWTKKRMYVENTGQSVFYGAYSDIAKLIDGDIAMLYEKGYRNEEGIWFRKIDISELE
jgi:sialidase-1